MNERRSCSVALAAASFALALATLSACGGMTNAVGVLPKTLDDLEAKSAAARGEPLPSQSCENPPCPDAAGR
ncbi:hypothetical protein [Fulvimarina sp. MAC3]|uniref:hypothetical protein n=1 Tax=Fulvimarina sp. MAC3 TaxID=3148887 RepID=UPI0031FC0A80